MGVDLKSNTMFRRMSIVLESDCLIKLEHERTKDRVRKLMFDRVDSVLVWRKAPVWRLLVTGLLLGGPAMIILVAGLVNALTPAIIIALFLLLLLAAVWVGYWYCKVTTIRITRGGKFEDIKGVFWPGKVRRLIQGMQANIHATQEAGFAKIAEQNIPAVTPATGLPTPLTAEPEFPASGSPPIPLL